MRTRRVLVTGSAGLIGRAVRQRLRARDGSVAGFDLRAEHLAARGDVLDREKLAAALNGIDGILHLAAVSRVIDGERDPERCRLVNVEGTRLLLELAAARKAREGVRAPWVIYASSREVYGQQDVIPVPESVPLRPKNIYARSKAEAERLVGLARDAGLRAAVLRFSNVYGDIYDHADRVVPAFARVAARVPSAGDRLRVDGAACTFDFTYVEDVADGIVRLMDVLQTAESPPPPIHLVTGQETSLGRLAALAMELGGPEVRMVEAPARNFDVHRFAGDPTTAERLLGWRAATSIETGFARLVEAYRSDALSRTEPFARAEREATGSVPG